jgi:hypothetical protein
MNEPQLPTRIGARPRTGHRNSGRRWCPSARKGRGDLLLNGNRRNHLTAAPDAEGGQSDARKGGQETEDEQNCRNHFVPRKGLTRPTAHDCKHIEYDRAIQLHPVGLEPTTLGSEDRCSIQLSYGCLISLAILLDWTGFDQSRTMSNRSGGISGADELSGGDFRAGLEGHSP